MKRNEYDIMYDILNSIVSKPLCGKTYIIYQCNLNFKVIKRYFGKMLEKGLLTVNNLRKYDITAKGLDYMRQYRDLVAVLEV